jgi:membrane peptidoglycan carboxypeptidase
MPRRLVRRTISHDVAAELTTILEQVVERGTATAARIEGYSIAGKTGTARKAEGGRYTDEYNSSFIGFLPSRNPRVTILAVIDAPRRKGYYGGTVAAPLFKRVAEATLRYLGIPPNVNPAPAVLVERIAEPAAAAPIPVRSAPAIEHLVRLGSATGTVPDIRGLSAREAVLALTRLGVEARVNGHGFVVDQSIAPGMPVGQGQVCTLSLKRDLVPVGGEPGTQP